MHVIFNCVVEIRCFRKQLDGVETQSHIYFSRLLKSAKKSNNDEGHSVKDIKTCRDL